MHAQLKHPLLQQGVSQFNGMQYDRASPWLLLNLLSPGSVWHCLAFVAWDSRLQFPFPLLCATQAVTEHSVISCPPRYLFSLLRVLLPAGNSHLSSSVGTNEGACRSECWQDHNITQDQESSASFRYCGYCLYRASLSASGYPNP